MSERKVEAAGGPLATEVAAAGSLASRYRGTTRNRTGSRLCRAQAPRARPVLDV